MHPALPAIATWLGCVSSPGADRGRAWPDASGPIPLGGGGVHTVLVAPEIAALPDPRFSAAPSRYTGQDEPWRRTEAQRIAAAALDLADLLGRATCTAEPCPPLPVAAWSDPGDEIGAVLVGRPEDFGLASPFSPPTPTTREQHALRTVPGGALVLGAAAAGVELAVWSLARELGYRWYLPDPDWEIVPHLTELPQIDRIDPGPQLAARRLVGPPSGAAGHRFDAWATRNGFVGGLAVKGVQAQWGRAAEALSGWLAENPGAISRTSRPSAHRGRTGQIKWCPSYRDPQGRSPAEQLAEVWVRPRLSWTPGQLDNTSARDVLPLHQGDNAYWSGCDDGLSPADRAVALANGVVDQLGSALGERMISVYGYREVFPGPRRERLRPGVFVWLIGRGYLGTPFPDALARWRAAGARHLGWYGYWSVPEGELPDDELSFLAVRPRAEELVGLADAGFEAIWLEADGPFALGGWWKWLLMDIARDPSGEDRIERRMDDLVTHAFPAGAREPVRRYLRRFDTSDRRLLLSPEWVGSAYADLAAARAASAADPAALARIDDLIAGVRWIALSLSGDPRRKALQPCLYGRSDGPCEALPVEDWLRDAPTAREPAWPPAPEARYARITHRPGSARTGTVDTRIAGLPRDADLWQLRLDPADGLTLRSICHGTFDLGGQPAPRTHITSRMLGTASLVLRDAAGKTACTLTLPPDRAARDITLRPDRTTIAPASPKGTACRATPRPLALDTGQPEPPRAPCDPSLLRGEGPYTLASLNHRSGLDYRTIEGPTGTVRRESPLGPHEARLPDTGRSPRYFYVPVGQRTVTLYSRGPCTLRRDDRRDHDVDLAPGGPGYRVVDTLGRDGELWAMIGCQNTWLLDLPPVVAPTREQWMAPCSLAERPADAARLGIVAEDCQRP